MEPFYKSKAFIHTAVVIGVLLLGILIGKFLFSESTANNPRLATFNGEAIRMKDVETGMTEGERSGNSLEYKKQLAAGLIQDKVLRELAANDGLSVQEYIKKVKSKADAAITNEELERFLKDGGFNRAKLTKAQLDNIRGNMQEQKREIYFKEFLKKELANAKITWDSP